MAIIPDTKDWTWVVERPCTECEYDASSVAVGDIASHIRVCASAWPAVLMRESVRVRPNNSTWSPLEYATHVRDVCVLYTERLGLMLTLENPLYPNWDQDAASVVGRYNEQGPSEIATEIVDAAEALAAQFESLKPEQWERTGRRSDGATFTVETFALYFLHDIEHHLVDVGGPPR
ncbi:MAG: DinB family protein [Microbacteriaceae bacterium]